MNERNVLTPMGVAADDLDAAGMVIAAEYMREGMREIRSLRDEAGDARHALALIVSAWDGYERTRNPNDRRKLAAVIERARAAPTTPAGMKGAAL